MAKYSIVIKSSAKKELSKLPSKDLGKVIKKINQLADNPRPRGCQKLTNRDEYRLRSGNYRILYTIEDRIKIVKIIKIGHRKNIYLK